MANSAARLTPGRAQSTGGMSGLFSWLTRSNSSPQGSPGGGNSPKRAVEVHGHGPLSEALIKYIFSWLEIFDLMRCQCASRHWRLLVRRHIQSFTVYYMNRRAFGVAISLTRPMQLCVWIGITHQWNLHFDRSRDQVLELVRAGVPAKMRGAVWPKLLRSEELMRKTPDIYQYCCKHTLDEENLHAIQKDIGRTFPLHPRFKAGAGGQEQLMSVLHAFSVFNREKAVEYCQGLNFLAGVLILNLPGPEEVFWALMQMMKERQMECVYSEGFPALVKLTSLFDVLTQECLPDVHAHFTKEGVSSNMFSQKWFLTVYACVLTDMDLLTRIWDWFLAEGWEAMIRVGLALLRRSSFFLLRMEIDKVFHFFDHLPAEITAAEDLLKLASAFVIDPPLRKALQDIEHLDPKVAVGQARAPREDLSEDSFLLLSVSRSPRLSSVSIATTVPNSRSSAALSTPSRTPVGSLGGQSGGGGGLTPVMGNPNRARKHGRGLLYESNSFETPTANGGGGGGSGAGGSTATSSIDTNTYEGDLLSFVERH